MSLLVGATFQMVGGSNRFLFFLVLSFFSDVQRESNQLNAVLPATKRWLSFKPTPANGTNSDKRHISLLLCTFGADGGRSACGAGAWPDWAMCALRLETPLNSRFCGSKALIADKAFLGVPAVGVGLNENQKEHRKPFLGVPKKCHTHLDIYPPASRGRN